MYHWHGKEKDNTTCIFEDKVTEEEKEIILKNNNKALE